MKDTSRRHFLKSLSVAALVGPATLCRTVATCADPLSCKVKNPQITVFEDRVFVDVRDPAFLEALRSPDVTFRRCTFKGSGEALRMPIPGKLRVEDCHFHGICLEPAPGHFELVGSHFHAPGVDGAFINTHRWSMAGFPVGTSTGRIADCVFLSTTWPAMSITSGGCV